MNKFSRLFSPLKVGPVVMKNRIETAPMSIVELDPKGGLTEQAIAFYENFAAGGAAVVTVGESIIASTNGMTHKQQIRFDNPAVPHYLRRMTDAIHAHGALANIEISHGGCMSKPANNNGAQSMGPTGFINEIGEEIKEMTFSDMQEIAAAFADAAETCRDCGFDIVMIHCAHEWLLAQFLSPHFNKRRDQFGGSIENRSRFPLMVLDAVRSRVGNSIAIDMRVSGSEFRDDGLNIEDVCEFCVMAEDMVDMINISAGAPWTKRMAISVFEERGINSEFSAKVKKAVTKVPVTSVGGYTDPELMERFLTEGRCDGFILGRSILADPELPEKARTGRAAQIHQCLRCYECNNSQYIDRGRLLRCAINPLAGREQAMRCVPQAKPRRIIVAGGGPGGMAAAVQAARRGHSVTLYEKSSSLGGWLKTEKNIPFKYDMWNYAQTLAGELELYGVEVKLNSVVTRELLEELKPDAVICAIGSEPIVPKIAGVDLPNVLNAADIFLESNKTDRSEAKIGRSVVIIGGGLVGCETGLHLAIQGHDVTIIEMCDRVAIDATADHRRFMMPLLEDKVKLACSAVATEITAEGVKAVGSDGRDYFFKADTVIVAAGLKARSDEVEELRSSEYDFTVIGDCLRARKLYYAVREGYDAATFTR